MTETILSKSGRPQVAPHPEISARSSARTWLLAGFPERGFIAELGILQIAGCECNREQLVFTGPGKRGVFQRLWFSANFNGKELDEKVRAWVCDGKLDRSDIHHTHSKFLSEFALDCLEVALGRLHLSPRKFPKPTVAFVVRSLANKELPFTLDDRRDYSDHDSNREERAMADGEV